MERLFAAPMLLPIKRSLFEMLLANKATIILPAVLYLLWGPPTTPWIFETLQEAPPEILSRAILGKNALPTILNQFVDDVKRKPAVFGRCTTRKCKTCWSNANDILINAIKDPL
ncbi:hypothetical protein M422DRAFT_277221 [Sphaerobolus stellatus SS14]|uniref:Uncharacterized protein n=1 Tax=Sphaerobolus stellatus (strain SS14) TaxID=990650 RepID=A0A0C9U0A0_SPHS4|nr:hypothetical protein M422DRAFT_277221 [Sphaerobolus stellatus SS14]